MIKLFYNEILGSQARKPGQEPSQARKPGQEPSQARKPGQEPSQEARYTPYRGIEKTYHKRIYNYKRPIYRKLFPARPINIYMKEYFYMALYF